jgi:hypothetical protein
MYVADMWQTRTLPRTTCSMRHEPVKTLEAVAQAMIQPQFHQQHVKSERMHSHAEAFQQPSLHTGDLAPR